MKNFAPKSNRQAEVAIVRQQPKEEPFAAGMMNDLPASAIPANAIAYSKGYIPFPRYLEPAGGCKPWAAVPLPGLPNRTDYTWTKTGNLIEKTAGIDFTAADVGNFLIHDDGRHELITVYIDANRVNVKSFATRAASSAGWLRGPINCKFHHRELNKIILHIDTRLYVADSTVTAYTQAYCISTTSLPNERSQIDETKDGTILQCSSGLFRINLEDDPIVYYRVNGPLPDTLITAVAKDFTKPYGHKYTYGLARISGDDENRTRLSEDSLLEHETPNNATNTVGLDCGLVYHDRPIGNQSSSFYKVTGVPFFGAGAAITDWNVISDGQFKISIDGTEYNLQCDFTGCATFLEVAEIIQQALRTVKSSLTCEISEDHFIITNPDEGGTLSTTSNGDAGTNVSLMMRTHSGVCNAIAYPFTKILTVGQLEIPDGGEGIYTHYPVYRSLDVGENGINPITGEGNNEEQFVWVTDVPVAKSFVASSDGSIVTATEGSFDPMDDGCVLRFQDGTEITLGNPAKILNPDTLLTGYISPTQFYTITAGAIASQACAIGGDNSLSKPIRVFTGSQLGTAISIAGGTTIAPDDVGKVIFWANGKRSTIREYIGGNAATAIESQTITLTGACMDPTTRAFCDTTSDEVLRARIVDFSLTNRFWQPLPDCELMAVVPGFIFVAASGGKIIYYGQIPNLKEYQIGYYNPRQYLSLKDTIVKISEFPDVIAIYCAHSTTIIPTNTYTPFDVNGIVQIAMISGQYLIDSQIGLKEEGALVKLPTGEDWMATSEPAVRIFNGRQFTDNLAKDRIMNILFAAVALSVKAFYDPFNGVSLHYEEPSALLDTSAPDFTYELGELVEPVGP